jgi:hypothetical protein
MVIRADKSKNGARWRAAMLMVAAVSAMAATLGAASGSAMASARAEQGTPLGRVWASWAYDPARHDIVLFGGDAGYQSSGPDVVFGKTWTWDGAAWTRRHPAASPSARTGAAIVYDGATHQLLLFGGSLLPFSGGGYQAGTWAWNGSTWTRLHPATSPPGRHNADMVYDGARHEVILFGGYDGRYLNDTWAWNGTTWNQLRPATSPPPRDTHSLVYDPASQTAILFGGFNGARLGDTWSWDGTTWTQLHPATSPGIVSTAWQAAWDGASRQLILFGGDESGVFSSSTWAWDGTTWNQLHPAVSPAQRAYGSLTYDRALHRLVLFAGSTGHTDPSTIWEWNGTSWRRH